MFSKKINKNGLKMISIYQKYFKNKFRSNERSLFNEMEMQLFKI